MLLIKLLSKIVVTQLYTTNCTVIGYENPKARWPSFSSMCSYYKLSTSLNRLHHLFSVNPLTSESVHHHAPRSFHSMLFVFGILLHNELTSLIYHFYNRLFKFEFLVLSLQPISSPFFLLRVIKRESLLSLTAWITVIILALKKMFFLSSSDGYRSLM